MPITPYHFGPSGLLGLLFRRWIDPVVFVAANIVVDVEVLFSFFGLSAASPHRVWHAHSFLIGGITGALFGWACWGIRPVRRLIEWIPRALWIPCRSSARAMILGGALGICLHVLIDGIYHYDVQALWPWRQNVFRYWIHFHDEWQVQRWVRWICAACFPVAVIVWQRIAMKSRRGAKDRP